MKNYKIAPFAKQGASVRYNGIRRGPLSGETRGDHMTVDSVPLHRTDMKPSGYGPSGPRVLTRGRVDLIHLYEQHIPCELPAAAKSTLRKFSIQPPKTLELTADGRLLIETNGIEIAGLGWAKGVRIELAAPGKSERSLYDDVAVVTVDEMELQIPSVVFVQMKKDSIGTTDCLKELARERKIPAETLLLTDTEVLNILQNTLIRGDELTRIVDRSGRVYADVREDVPPETILSLISGKKKPSKQKARLFIGPDGRLSARCIISDQPFNNLLHCQLLFEDGQWRLRSSRRMSNGHQDLVGSRFVLDLDVQCMLINTCFVPEVGLHDLLGYSTRAPIEAVTKEEQNRQSVIITGKVRRGYYKSSTDHQRGTDIIVPIHLFRDVPSQDLTSLAQDPEWSRLKIKLNIVTHGRLTAIVYENTESERTNQAMRDSTNISKPIQQLLRKYGFNAHLIGEKKYEFSAENPVVYALQNGDSPFLNLPDDIGKNLESELVAESYLNEALMSLIRLAVVDEENPQRALYIRSGQYSLYSPDE